MKLEIINGDLLSGEIKGKWVSVDSIRKKLIEARNSDLSSDIMDAILFNEVERIIEELEQKDE